MEGTERKNTKIRIMRWISGISHNFLGKIDQIGEDNPHLKKSFRKFFVNDVLMLLWQSNKREQEPKPCVWEDRGLSGVF